MNELAHMENASAEETTEASEVAFRAATLKVLTHVTGSEKISLIAHVSRFNFSPCEDVCCKFQFILASCMAHNLA